MNGRAVINLTTGLEDTKRVTVAFQATACEGCPPLTICVQAKKLDDGNLIEGAEVGGTVPLWQWIGEARRRSASDRENLAVHRRDRHDDVRSRPPSAARTPRNPRTSMGEVDRHSEQTGAGAVLFPDHTGCAGARHRGTGAPSPCAAEPVATVAHRFEQPRRRTVRLFVCEAHAVGYPDPRPLTGDDRAALRRRRAVHRRRPDGGGTDDPRGRAGRR